MNDSFTRATESALHRSRCCRQTRFLPKGKLLPLCPKCHEPTAWDASSHRPEWLAQTFAGAENRAASGGRR